MAEIASDSEKIAVTAAAAEAAAPPPSTRLSPPLPWRTRLFIAALQAVTDAARRSDGTINRRLLSFLDRRRPASSKPYNGVSSADVHVDSSRDLWFRIFVPSAASSANTQLPIVVFFHGGGFAFLSPATLNYDAVCRRIARKANVVVASVNYRLSPEHKYPSQYEDGIDVLRFLDSGGLNGVTNAVNVSNCFLAGDSAGGNIVHHVARRWAAAKSSFSRVNLRGIVLIQPFFGGEEITAAETRLEGAPLVSTARTEWLWKAFLPAGENRDHPAVNVFGPSDSADLEEDFPTAMIVIGGYDPLQDWQRRYCEVLKKRGKEAELVEFENGVHAFYVFPELKESGELIHAIREFVERCCCADKKEEE